MLTKKMAREAEHRLAFTIPIFEPLPSQYYIRCARCCAHACEPLTGFFLGPTNTRVVPSNCRAGCGILRDSCHPILSVTRACVPLASACLGGLLCLRRNIADGMDSSASAFFCTRTAKQIVQAASQPGCPGAHRLVLLRMRAGQCRTAGCTRRRRCHSAPRASSCQKRELPPLTLPAAAHARRVVSDGWLHAEATLPLSFQGLILPETRVTPPDSACCCACAQGGVGRLAARGGDAAAELSGPHPAGAPPAAHRAAGPGPAACLRAGLPGFRGAVPLQPLQPHPDAGAARGQCHLI